MLLLAHRERVKPRVCIVDGGQARRAAVRYLASNAGEQLDITLIKHKDTNTTAYSRFPFSYAIIIQLACIGGLFCRSVKRRAAWRGHAGCAGIVAGYVTN